MSSVSVATKCDFFIININVVFGHHFIRQEISLYLRIQCNTLLLCNMLTWFSLCQHNNDEIDGCCIDRIDSYQKYVAEDEDEKKEKIIWTFCT